MKHSETKINRREVIGKLGAVSGLGLLSAHASAVFPGEGAVVTDDKRIKLFDTLVNAQMSVDIQEGDFILTAGYYDAGDGGAAGYLIVRDFHEQEVNPGDSVPFSGDYIGVLTGVVEVNYKIFGARGDSMNDDGIQIKAAHDYANRHKLPVINMKGEYWIKETRNIRIKTSVQWGATVFHIKEAYNTKDPVFVVSGYDEEEEVFLGASEKRKVIEALKPGCQQIPELKAYKNSLVYIEDSNDRIGFRAGYSGQSRARQELFFLEENGRVTGDIAWSFKDYTQLMVYPGETSYLTVEGGTFFLSGEGAPPDEQTPGYLRNGFHISRSRTIVKNQWMGLEPGKSDVAMNPRSGFYYMSNVYDVTLENIRLIPWEKDREGTHRDVPAGTYGIGGNRMLKTTFRNISAEGTSIYWGVFGTNMNKDFRVENCRLNRIDVHFHCWNLSIKDSHIGNKGITLTGGGELVIENTSCDTSRFVTFRRDFGAKWDGPVVIKNCRLRPYYSSKTAILSFVASDFDYGYPIGLAKSISVEDFVFDYRSVPSCKNRGWLIQSSPFSAYQNGKRSFFPESIRFRNIRVEGRSKGLHLMNFPAPGGFLLPKEGGYDGIHLKANAFFYFEDIQLDEGEQEGASGFHFQFSGDTDLSFDSFSLFPQIHFVNCPSLAVNLGGAPSSVVTNHCGVNFFTTGRSQPLQGEIAFVDCRFIPVQGADGAIPFILEAALGTSFTNCTFHLASGNPYVYSDRESSVGFIKINESVSYNHIHSRLGKDVIRFLKKEGIAIKPDFIQMLKSHHELEDDS